MHSLAKRTPGKRTPATQPTAALLSTGPHRLARGKRTRRVAVTALVAAVFAVLVAGCTTTPNNPNITGDSSLAGRVQECRTGDTAIASSDACLQDDAACYQLSDGSWCTGPRGTECPAGSSEIPANAPCPEGNRCFTIGESKNCAISFK